MNLNLRPADDHDPENASVLVALLQAVTEEARRRGCCQITQEDDPAARRAYCKAGFRPYGLAPAPGQVLFWEKPL